MISKEEADMLKSRLLTPIWVGTYIKWTLIGSGVVIFIICIGFLSLEYQGEGQMTGKKEVKSKELQKKPLLL